MLTSVLVVALGTVVCSASAGPENAGYHGVLKAREYGNSTVNATTTSSKSSSYSTVDLTSTSDSTVSAATTSSVPSSYITSDSTSTSNTAVTTTASSSASTSSIAVGTTSTGDTALNATATSSNTTSYITVDITSTVTYTTSYGTDSGGIPTFAANGTGSANITGLAAASSCNAAKWDWVGNSGLAFVSNTTVATSRLTLITTIIRSDWTVTSLTNSQVYTLCDGYPRLNGTTSITGIDTTPASISTVFFTTTTPVSRNVSAPTCVIGSSACAVLQSEYTAASIAYSNYVVSGYSATLTISAPPYATSPICGRATIPPFQMMTEAPAACAVNTASLQLLYWPVATIGGDLCHGNGSTVTATPTIPGQPNTVLYMNTTLTSPTVYMQFKNVFAIGTDYVAKSSFQNTLLPLAPTAVSSRCGLVGGGFGPLQSMDYADLNQPVPASAYRCQPKCFTNDQLPENWQTPYTKYATENRCSTIWNDYNPALSVPTEFATVFPSAGFINSDLPGLACTFILDPDGGNIFFDPPSALTQAQTAAGPSIPTGGAGQTTTDHQTHHTLPVVALSSTTLAQGPSVPTVSAEPLRLSTISGTDYAISITQFSLYPVALSSTSSAEEPSVPVASVSSGTAADRAPASSASRTGHHSPLVPQALSSQSDPPQGPAVPTASSSADSPVQVPAAQPNSEPNGQAVPTSSVGVGGVIVSYIVPAAIPAPASTTSAGIGGIIASVLGVTRSTASNPAVAASSIDPEYPAAQKPAPGNTDPGSQTSSPQTATVGGQAFTVKPAANDPSAVVVANGATTATLAPGATTVIGNQHISAPSSGGVVVGSGSGAATLAPAASPADPAGSGPARLPAITAGNSVVTPDNTASQYVVGSQTLAPGSSAIVVSGTTYSLAPSGTALVANGVTQALPSAGPASSGPSYFIAGGQTLSQDSSSNVVVAGQTLHPGSQTVIAGTTYSLAPSATALAVNGITQSLHPGSSASAALPYFTAGGQTLTQDSSSNLVIAGQTLHPGSQTVIAGTTYSLAPSATALAVNGVTQSLHPGSSASATVPYFTAGGQTLTQDSSSNLIIAGQTLHPGSQAVLSGTTYSLAPSGSALVVNGVTQAPHSLAAPTGGAVVFTINGQTLTEDASSNIVLPGGQTVHPGSQTVVAGTTYSLAPSGSALIINGLTQSAHTAPTGAAAGFFTLPNSQTRAEDASSNLLLPGGQTLRPGSSATVIGGTTYSLAPSGSALVVNGATQTLRPAAGPATSALAGISAASGSSVGGSSVASTSKSSAALGRGSCPRGGGVAVVVFAAVVGVVGLGL
ncbi:hypothetical protein LTR02_001610 [Friedmanniomyces endolithicus]|nr:hypothetical protein LTR38_009633 [Friedmanniomyces endolithicus]KAK0800918.1 hypothetical protein LTR75_008741 [Friedmanniomyces endolithicus]KAK0810971.1 hypothetical protein LTR59_001982 [Friedmanniomyces endolithicus]KAK0841645.1 hypothetical protein LTR03_009786 [Friedmanniomyces endolithicus]KAK0914875.1 hypothetical protein LTR02_001610 [Friedmanniomyces endolithicus]